MQISVTTSDTGVAKVLATLQARVENLTPAMKIVGRLIRDSVVKNFEAGGRPKRWKPSARAMLEEGQTLRDSGRLYKSIVSKAYADRAVIGTNVIYALIHQTGGRTPAHVIRPKTKKALFWPGARHPVGAVRHPGSNIPPRPYLLVQDEDYIEIEATLTDYIMSRGSR
ncbi:MAG: phage virion morphogenesis protein [Thermodesulfobacteriota bacterium]